MDPVTNKILQGVPYAGMGSTLERNALIGVIRNLISQDRYNVDYILNYAESVGYQRQMAEDVFKELTGLSPKLIVNNNAYFDMPSYVPNMCIAWGISKSNKEKAFYIVPFEYGFAVMEKDEVNAPIPTVISATIPEAFEELKKVAKGIQTLDKIITKKLLEAEDVQTDAHTVHQVNLPYAASPLQILKKNFKDKVLSVSEFERQASKLLASEEITVDEAEDLMAWKQDLIDEDETYGNDVLELDEQWKPLNAEVDDDDFNGYHSSEEYLNSYEYLYETLVNGNITLYKEKLNKLSKSELMDYIAWAEEMGIGREELKLHYITASKKQSGIVPTEKVTLNDGRTFTVRYNPNEKSITTILDENGREVGVDTGTRLQLLRKLFHKGEPTIVESKKKNAGYSNNPDYVGDWFGKGQIDYSKIINPEDDGKVWMLKIWGGSGYILDVYLVKANDYEEAIDITFKWSYENEGKNKVIKDYEYLSKFCKEDYEDEWFYGKGEGKPSDKMSYEDFEMRWFEDFVGDSYNELFAYSENFFIDELPEGYTNKKQSSKKVISESVSVKDLEQRAKRYEELLKEEGYTDMKVTPNFAYGAYGFYFDWTRADGKLGQKYTGLGTKAETVKNLDIVYYQLVNDVDWFMKIKSADSNLNDSIKEWYKKTYKTDECGEDINPNTTFMEVLSDAENAYDLIGVTDSIVRERVFDELSKRTNIPYEKIHNMWMGKQASKKVANNDGYDKTVDDLRNEFVSFVADKRPDDVNAAPVVYDYFMGLAKHDDLHSKLRDCYNGSEKESWEKFDELLNLVRYWWNNYNKLNKKSASKKVTAENMTLDDIEAEDNKDQVQEEIEKIDETPAEDIFSETTPEQYFDKALQEDKVDTINDVVSKCIDKFSEKFKDFDKYQVKILSYNTKVLGDDKPVQEEMVEDKELNANAILQVILQITNNAEEENIKKVLAVFSITNGELHWTGTVRGENDQVVAFTEEGLDALFEVNEPSEEELEDII